MSDEQTITNTGRNTDTSTERQTCKKSPGDPAGFVVMNSALQLLLLQITSVYCSSSNHLSLAKKEMSFPPLEGCPGCRLAQVGSHESRSLSEDGKFLLHLREQKPAFQELMFHCRSIHRGNRPDAKSV